MTHTPRLPWQVKFVLLALIWGSSFLFMKVGLSALDPIQIATFRIFSGAVILALLARLTGTRLPRDRRVWAHLAFCSLWLTVLPFTGFVIGETRVASALAGIGNATTPISAVLAGLVLLPAQRLRPAALAAVGLGFLGVIVIAEPWNAGGRPDPLGFLIVVLSGACYGVGWTWNRRFLADADLGGLSQPTALLLCGAVLALPGWFTWWGLHRDTVATPFSLAAHAGTAVGDGRHAAYPIWLALTCVAILGFVGTGLAYMLQYDVARAVGAVVSTTVTYLIPVVSVLLGVLVLGEHLGVAQLAGFAIVLSCAVVINRSGRGPRGAGSSPSGPSATR